MWGCGWWEDVGGEFSLRKSHSTTQIGGRFASYRHFDRGNGGWGDRGGGSGSGLVVFWVHGGHVFDSTQAPVGKQVEQVTLIGGKTSIGAQVTESHKM